MDDDVNSPVVINNDNNVKEKNNTITISMWVSIIIGILLGVCICGFADQLSNMVDFMNFIQVNIEWWMWLILITILSILFLFLESKFRKRIEV